MKKILIALFSAALILSLSACSGSGSSSKQESESSEASQESSQSVSTGNKDKFVMSKKQVGDTHEGLWSSQENYKEKIRFDSDFGFTHYIDKDIHKGTAELNEGSGMLTFRYDDGFKDEKSYIWVDTLGNVNSNTWYIDGGTFAFGNMVMIRDMDF